MDWPRNSGDQIKLMENLSHLYKMKLESGCIEEEAWKWIKEMVEIYGEKMEGKMSPYTVKTECPQCHTVFWHNYFDDIICPNCGWCLYK